MHIQRTAALVADDHELFRSGFALLLRREFGFSDVVETRSLDEAVQVLAERPDISFASFDVTMPGLESAHRFQTLRETFPRVCFVVVSGSRKREDMLLALTAGVRGYVLKTWRTTEISVAIERVLNGEIFLPPSVAELTPRFFPSADPIKDQSTRLTKRQEEVLRLITNGKSNKEIARLLNLAESTVKVHTNALYRALGVHNRSSAAVALLRQG